MYFPDIHVRVKYTALTFDIPFLYTKGKLYTTMCVVVLICIYNVAM